MTCRRNMTVFPTHVGMNRWLYMERVICECIPHARGDEPNEFEFNFLFHNVFPTHVGMNRHADGGNTFGHCIPHARGDEPECGARYELRVPYSPRTWG